jgi:hypothetical protein
VIKEGFLTVLPVRTDVRLNNKLKWKIQGGDRT